MPVGLGHETCAGQLDTNSEQGFDLLLLSKTRRSARNYAVFWFKTQVTAAHYWEDAGMLHALAKVNVQGTCDLKPGLLSQVIAADSVVKE